VSSALQWAYVSRLGIQKERREKKREREKRVNTHAPKGEKGQCSSTEE
jgi:hypothetical protein